MDLHNMPPNLMNYPDPSEFDYAAFLHATGDTPATTTGYPIVPNLTHPPNLSHNLSHSGLGAPRSHSHQHLSHNLPPHHGHSHQQPLPSGSHASASNGLPPSAVGTPMPYYAEQSRLETSPSSDNNRSSSVTSDLTRTGTLTSAAKQRLERRGHTKSRRGCYNCKRRRIKCQETRPACGHCVKTGLQCEYPSMPQITHQPHHQIPLFSLQDMRFFQHFLTQCYPHHPLGQENIWTHDIPCIAHNHEFLMHAILGFAASELISTDPTLVSAAMAHRIKAVKAIKKRLSESTKMNTTYEEANALVATCFALTFQSVSLDDGLAEYMTFIRGITIVTMQMMFRNIKPMFENLLGADQNEILAPVMDGLPLIQRGWADMATEAINALRPLCVEQAELEYIEKLSAIVEKLYHNSFDAYKANSQLYAWWMLLPHATFQELIHPDSQIMMLLHAHWIALSQIMVFITEQEYEVRAKQPEGSKSPSPAASPAESSSLNNPGFHRWLRHINSQIDYEHQMYNQWPMWVDEQLERDGSFFGKREASSHLGMSSITG